MTDKASYLSEMTAAGAAIGAFFTVYLAGLAYVGPLATLLVGWLPALAVALLTARAVRNLMTLFADLEQGRLGSALPVSRPATVQMPLDDDFARYVRRRRD